MRQIVLQNRAEVLVALDRDDEAQHDAELALTLLVEGDWPPRARPRPSGPRPRCRSGGRTRMAAASCAEFREIVASGAAGELAVLSGMHFDDHVARVEDVEAALVHSRPAAT